MSGHDFGGGHPFHSSFGGPSRLSGSGSEGFEARGPRPPHNRASFPPVGPDSWGASEREHSWSGPPGEASGTWGPRDSPLMPPGNIISGRGPPSFGENRGRPFFGRGPDFGHRGRGGPGRYGRGRWSSEGDFDGRSFEGRSFEGRGGRDFQMGERPSFVSRGAFRGRGDFGRGRGGPSRFGGRYGGGGFEGRSRRDVWADDAPREPDIDPALLERRRTSASALLKRQVAQLQVSQELLREDEAAEVYSKIMDSESEQYVVPDVRQLYTYPIFSAEAMGTVPTLLTPPSDQMSAFEHCLHMYQDAQAGHTLVQSDHGNFLTPE